MSTFKGTQGPWVYKPATGKMHAVMGMGGKIVVFKVAPDEADARLMEAAPDLLEALQQAFDFPPDFFDSSDDELEQITVSGRHLRMVRAAIAKATGEPA